MEFEEIYLKYSPRIFRVCMGYLNDRQLAQDLTQETFISVWQNLAAFKGKSHISTWIFRIATNKCLRAIEVSKKMPKTGLPFDLATADDESQEEKLSYLYNCIAELEEIDRIIISLVLEGLPQAEIAAIVGLSIVNTRVRIHRAKEKLAVKFKKAWKI